MFCAFKYFVSLHRQKRLGYGVMVTQQILVLFFQVRILVAQHRKKEICTERISFFIICLCCFRLIEIRISVFTFKCSFYN